MTTIATGNRRLLELAAFLDTLPREKFDFRKWVSKTDSKGCGTVCCAVGWTPHVFPELASYHNDCVLVCDQSAGPGAMELFAMSSDEVLKVFFARNSRERNSGLPQSATPARVAEHIRKFVARRSGGRKKIEVVS